MSKKSQLNGVPDALPLEPEEAGDDGVLEERAVLLGRHREVPQRLRLRQRPRRGVVVRGEFLGLKRIQRFSFILGQNLVGQEGAIKF